MSDTFWTDAKIRNDLTKTLMKLDFISPFMEYTFYGTGLDVSSNFSNNQVLTVSVDGGPTIKGTGTINVVSGLPLGIHHVKVSKANK